MNASNSLNALVSAIHLPQSNRAIPARKLYQAHRDPKPSTTLVFNRKVAEIRLELEAIAKALDILKVAVETKPTMHDCYGVDALASRTTLKSTNLRQQQAILPYLAENISIASGFNELQGLHEMHHFIQEKIGYLELITDGQELETLHNHCTEWQNACLNGTQTIDATILGHAKPFIINQHARAVRYPKALFLRIRALQEHQLEFFHQVLKSVGREGDVELVDALRELKKLDNPYKIASDIAHVTTTIRRLEFATRDEAKSKSKADNPLIRTFKEQYKEMAVDCHYLYPHAKPINLAQLITKLQDGVAKGLLFLRKEVHEHLQAVFQGKTTPRRRETIALDITFYEEVHKELRDELLECKSDLNDRNMAPEIVQARNYLFTIQGLADEVEEHIGFFSSLYEVGYLPKAQDTKNANSIANVLILCNSFLTSRTVEIRRADTTQDLQEIQKLFQALVADSSLKRHPNPKSFLELFCSKTLATCETALAVAGRRVLVSSPAEKGIASSVFAKFAIPATDVGELPHDLKSDLEKRATNLLYYPQPTVDYEFDLMLYNVEHAVQYAPLFAKSIQRDETFSDIISLYKAHFPLVMDLAQLEILSDIFMLLERLEQKISDSKKSVRAILDVVWYVQLRQLLFHVTPSTSDRVQCLYNTATKRLTAYERTAKLPDYAPQLATLVPPDETGLITEQVLTPYLYKLVAQALWSRTNGTKEGATAMLIEKMKFKEHFIPEDKFFLRLLQELALVRQIPTPAIYLLMKDYVNLQDLTTRSALRELHEIDYVEQVLYTLYSEPELPVQNGLRDAVGQFRECVRIARRHFLVPWSEFMHIYCRFQSSQTPGEKEALLRQANKIAQEQRDIDADFDRIMLRCLKVMDSSTKASTPR